MDEREERGFKGFLSANSDSMVKLFVYHVAMCIFGLVVALALEMVAAQIDGGTHLCLECDTYYEVSELLGEELLCPNCQNETSVKLSVATYVAGAFGAIVYLGLIYVCMWEKGAKDKIKIDGGRLERNNFKGLLIWLVANSVIIFILLNIAILSFIKGAENVHGLLTIVGLYTNAMYYAFLWFFSYIDVTALYLVVLIPGALVASLSYYSGVKGDKCLFPEPKHEHNRMTR